MVNRRSIARRLVFANVEALAIEHLCNGESGEALGIMSSAVSSGWLAFSREPFTHEPSAFTHEPPSGACSSVVAVDPSPAPALEEAPTRVPARAGATGPERRGPTDPGPRRSPLAQLRSCIEGCWSVSSVAESKQPRFSSNPSCVAGATTTFESAPDRRTVRDSPRKSSRQGFLTNLVVSQTASPRVGRDRADRQTRARPFGTKPVPKQSRTALRSECSTEVSSATSAIDQEWRG